MVSIRKIFFIIVINKNTFFSPVSCTISSFHEHQFNRIGLFHITNIRLKFLHGLFKIQTNFQMAEAELRCNFKHCRKAIEGMAWVTACSHVFCDEDGEVQKFSLLSKNISFLFKGFLFLETFYAEPFLPVMQFEFVTGFGFIPHKFETVGFL